MWALERNENLSFAASGDRFLGLGDMCMTGESKKLVHVREYIKANIHASLFEGCPILTTSIDS